MSPEPVAPPSPRSGGSGWAQAPCAVLRVNPDGAVAELNPSAERLFPGVTGTPLADGVPGWFADAHRQLTAGTEPHDGQAAAGGWIGERSFDAYPVAATDASVTWWLLDNTDARQARTELDVQRHRAGVLAELSAALLATLNPQRCMEITARLAAEHLADAAVVLAPGNRAGLPAARCVRGGPASYARLPARAEDVPGLGDVLEGLPAPASRWIDPARLPEWLLGADIGEIGSVVLTPLPGQGAGAGALVLLRRAGEPAFAAADEAFAGDFAVRAGTAMATARIFAQQTSITETLLQDLLPPTLHQIDGVEFAGRYRPAGDTERVGGDFYDVHPCAGESEHSLAVLGDVCGKGLEAAVLTGKVRNTLHALLPLADDHERLLRLLNGALLSSHHTRFVTLALASVERRAQGVRLRLTCAGHLPPLLLRASGEVQTVHTRGTLIGALPEITAHTAEVDLAAGETCLLYTDGITEAVGGPLGNAMFGEDGLRQALAACAGMPAEAVVEHVQMLAMQWVGTGIHDDMATLAITAHRGQHLTAVDGRGPGRFTA